MKKYIILLFVLLGITYTQAQDWINNESTLLYEDIVSIDENTQYIEEYDTNHLLTTINKVGTNQYAFRLWKNNSDIFEGFLQDSNYVITDFEIINDSAYFCGYRITNGAQIGYIGQFCVSQFLNNQNCAYRIMDIPQITKLKKLVAYETNSRDHIVAIGDDTYNYPIVVNLFPDSICNIFTTTLFPYEQLTDIAVGNNCVLIIGEDTDSTKITINRFDKHNLINSLIIPYRHCKYNYNSITSIAPLMIFSEQLKISNIGNGKMAITTTGIALGGGFYYTLVSVVDELNLNILSTQAIHHNDKMIKIKDTEYDSITQSLYVLEENNIDNTGKFANYILVVNPYAQSTYTLDAIKPAKKYKLNDIIALSLGDKIIGIGIDNNFYQGLFAKKVSNTLQHCNTRKNLKVDILGQIPRVNVNTYNMGVLPINWSQNNFQPNLYPQIIECQ